MEIRECSPFKAKTSMEGPLGGNAGSPHHLMSESLMAGTQAPVGGPVSSQDPKSVL
jgi:hypothetical protein